MLVIFFYVCIFFTGLAFGSFLNCLIYRLAGGRSLWGRSFCPKCQKQITWRDNIPLISFVLLGGRCRFCRQKISWRYPLVELATGLLFFWSVWRLNNQLSIISYQLVSPSAGEYLGFILAIFRDWMFFFTLLFIFVYDLKYSRIEDVVLLPATAILFILNLGIFLLSTRASGFLIVDPIKQMAIGAVILVGFFAFQYFLTKGKGIGAGDLRIGLFMGVALADWRLAVVALFSSYIIGGFISLLLVAFGRKKMKSQIPLGPFLSFGAAVAFIWGQQLIDWYIR